MRLNASVNRYCEILDLDAPALRPGLDEKHLQEPKSGTDADITLNALPFNGVLAACSRTCGQDGERPYVS
jgi:hypothetical protein